MIYAYYTVVARSFSKGCLFHVGPNFQGEGSSHLQGSMGAKNFTLLLEGRYFRIPRHKTKSWMIFIPMIS